MASALVCGKWQVETVVLDRGGGVREWIEIRHGGCLVRRVVSMPAAQGFFDGFGLRLADFTVAEDRR